MPDRQNPLGVKVLGSIQLGKDEVAEKRTVSRLIEDGLRADQARTTWLSHQRYLTRLRFGMRRPRTFPWKGASNLSIPYIDKIIRKYKPLLMRLLVEPDPIVEFVGEDEEAVEQERKAEEVYNWLFKTDMAALDTMAYLIDILLHRGIAYAHVGWEYRTEYECRVCTVADLFPQTPTDPNQVLGTLAQEYDIDVSDQENVVMLGKAADKVLQGAQFVKLSYRRTVKDRPAIWERDPVQIIMPSRTVDVPNSEWIIVQHVVSLRRLEQMEADGFFDKGVVKKIFDSILQGNREPNPNLPRVNSEVGPQFTNSLYQEKITHDELERIWGTEDENNILVWQVYHWYDADGDGLAERVESYIHPKSRTKMSARPYIAPFNEWPLIQFNFERTHRRIYSSRGIPAMLEGLQREINAQHNARIDAMTLHNSPTYQTQLLAGFKARNFRVTPGTVLQLPAGASISPIPHDRGSFPEMVNEENLIRNIGEDYVGTYDATISGAASPQSARTATEIQASQQAQQTVASFDTILFQLTMRELHTKIWQLFLDLGPKDIFVKVLGEQTALREPITVKKSEISRKFKLIPTGTIANTNRALELAHAREAMQIYLQDQTGYINPFELRRWHLTLLDYRWSRRMLNSPDQAKHLQFLQQAAAELQKNPELQAQMNAGAQPQPEQPDQQETQTSE